MTSLHVEVQLAKTFFGWDELQSNQIMPSKKTTQL
jgi:hypothetical protein